MRIQWIAPAFAVLFGVVACGKKTDESSASAPSTAAETGGTHAHAMHGSAAPNFAPGETREFGVAPDASAPAMSVSSLLSDCATGQTCVVEGLIGASCTSSGCWSTITEAGSDAIVFVEMKDEAFTFPKNAAGATGVLSGTLERASFSVAEANYYRSQTARVKGEDAPERVSEQVQGWVFTIDGARLTAKQ